MYSGPAYNLTPVKMRKRDDRHICFKTNHRIKKLKEREINLKSTNAVTYFLGVQENQRNIKQKLNRKEEDGK